MKGVLAEKAATMMRKSAIDPLKKHLNPEPPKPPNLLNPQALNPNPPKY